MISSFNGEGYLDMGLVSGNLSIVHICFEPQHIYDFDVSVSKEGGDHLGRFGMDSIISLSKLIYAYAGIVDDSNKE